MRDGGVMVVGKLVETASRSLRQTLIGAGLLRETFTTDEFQAACRAYREKFGELKAHATYQQPSYINWDDEKYQGDAYGAYAWAVYVADVSVDLTTYEVKVEDFVALQEVGKVVHPILAAGQIGVTLAGCPLEEKISEFHAAKVAGHAIGALAIITVLCVNAIPIERHKVNRRSAEQAIELLIAHKVIG